MVFIDPSKEEVFQTLLNNDYLIEYLKKERVLISKELLSENCTKEYIEELTQMIIVDNTETLYGISKVLLAHKEEIMSKTIRELLSEFVGWDELADALGIKPNDLTTDIYIHIVYTYKYCYLNSFFQNNKKLFIPDFDYYQLENNPASMAFYDATLKEFDKLDYMLEQCTHYLDFDSIPWDLIDYFTQILGFEKNRLGLGKDERKTREVIKNIIDIYRIKGTNYSFKLFFELLGYDIEISEYYFDRRLLYSTKSSNEETTEMDIEDYSYYLTKNNPSDNKLDFVSVNEYVSTSDLTPQYSLFEFNDLVKKYGIKAVLGYSKFYYDKKENKYLKYTDKVFKYFKTNYIYYDIFLSNDTIPSDEYKTIVKILNFLTPSYVMRRATTARPNNVEDSLSFNGDGTKPFDNDKNSYGKFEMLDDEDWSQHLQEKLKGDNYKNSLYDIDKIEGRKFRFPIRNRATNISLNKFYKAPAEYVENYNTVKYFWENVNGKYIPDYSIAPNLNLKEGDKKSVENQLIENKKKFTTYSNPRLMHNYSLTGKGDEQYPSIREILKERNIYEEINSGAEIINYLPNGKYYYNTTEGQLYVGDINNKAIKTEDFFGRFEFKNGKAKLYLYDEAWKGYDEEEDKDSFIAYNHEHTIDWPIMGFDNKKIGRPIKSKTDQELIGKENNLIDYIFKNTFFNFKQEELNGYDDTDHYIEIDKTYQKDIISPKKYNMYEKLGENYKPSSDEKIIESKIYYIKVAGEGLKNNSSKEIINLYKEYTTVDAQSMLYNIYTINYFLNNKGGYYKDDYDFYYDPYSEALDISKMFFEGNKDTYLKNYYYNKLVALYREKFIDDQDVFENVIDKYPMFLTNRVLNTFSRNKGKLSFKNDMVSSYKVNNNNGNKESIKMKFYRIEITNKEMKIFTNSKYIFEAFGHNDISKNNRVPVVKLKFENNNYKNLENIYNNGIIESISNSDVAIIKFKTDLNDLIIDINDDSYMEINKLENKLADNSLFYPFTNSKYLNKDIYERADEFISFGDDRDFKYLITNKNKDKPYKCRAFLNENKKIVLRVPKNIIDNMEISNVQITIS